MKHQPESDYYDDNGAQYNESAKETPLPAFKRHPKFCSSTKWGTGNRLDAANAKIHERNGEWNHCEWALELKASRSCKNNATDQKNRSQKSPQKLDCTFAANCPGATRRCFDRRCHRGGISTVAGPSLQKQIRLPRRYPSDHDSACPRKSRILTIQAGVEKRDSLFRTTKQLG